MSASSRIWRLAKAAAGLAFTAGLFVFYIVTGRQMPQRQPAEPREEIPEVEPSEQPPRSRISLPGRPVLILLTLMFIVAAWGVIALAARRPGPEQPIPFSHRIHAGTKDLSCFFCHPNATSAAHAGLPSVEKCLLCHDVIATNWEPIAKIKEYQRKGEGIPWVRVNRLPDFVRFSHQAHLARGFDCSMCHGNVKAMDRLHVAHDLKMGFCVDCHEANGATRDCSHCHY